MPQMAMVHDVDPAKQVWEQVSDLSNIHITGNYVLIGIYLRPEKTKGGVILTEKYRAEDQHQGKAGLILKMGPKAFRSDDSYSFDDSEICRIGDWVAIFISDGRAISINKQPCRLVEDQHIRLRIPAPDTIW